MKEHKKREIVNFYGGLPLPIVRFLQFTKSNTSVEWNEVVHQRLNHASNRRFELQEIQTTLEVLRSSYDDLRGISKLYFLYMGVLQEDLRVEIEKLCLLLLAERLIRGKMLRDVEQRYVTEIAEKGMVDLDEGEVPTITRFKYGQLTEIMRDLSLFKNKDECFFKVVEFGHRSQRIPDRTSPSREPRSSPSREPREPRTYRVAINFDEYEQGFDFPLKDDEKESIRVLLLSSKEKKVWPRELGLAKFLAKFKYLRILDFNGFNFGEAILLGGIARAVYLRYLSFKDCSLRELPSSIGSLKFLYILDLRVQQTTTTIIPNVLWKLKKLRHLYFPVFYETPDGSKLILNGLIELETITNYNTKMFNVEDLLKLPNLQYLDSNVDANLEEVECIIKLMKMSSHLNSLRISLKIRDFDCYSEERHTAFTELLACESLTILCIYGHIGQMPACHMLSQNLIKIEFIYSEFMEDPMTTLAKLPKLRELVFDNAFVGEEIVCSASGFVELRLLRLSCLLCLKKWVVEDGAMSKLSTLEIVNCGNLEMWPEGLEKLPKLRELVLGNAFVGEEIVCSASGFVELRLLTLSCLPRLRKWVVEDGAMSKLSTLKIANCGKLEMWPEGLEKLPKLRELVLDNAFVGEEIVCSASGFVELRLLTLSCLPRLKKWVVEDGAMSKLSTLKIANCEKLVMWPLGLRTVRGLRELKVSGMRHYFKTSISKGKDQDELSIEFED